MTNPFEYLKTITDTKEQLDPKDYNAYIVNKGLSYYRDCILIANEMNKYNFLPKEIQYQFFLNTITSKKRYSKWVKKTKSEDIETIQKYYGYNMKKAIECLDILTPEQLKEIKNKISTGGVAHD